jgi:hypothetical protein
MTSTRFRSRQAGRANQHLFRQNQSQPQCTSLILWYPSDPVSLVSDRAILLCLCIDNLATYVDNYYNWLSADIQILTARNDLEFWKHPAIPDPPSCLDNAS